MMIGIGHYLYVCARVQKLRRKEEKRAVPSEEEEDPSGLLPLDPSEPRTRHTYGSSPNRLGHRGNTTRTGTSNQLHYLRTLLGLAGFSAHLPVSVAFAFLPSFARPLHPSHFDSVEQDWNRHDHDRDDSFCELRTRPNRRLLFCLTDEILGQLLRPHLRLRPSLPSSRGPLAMFLPVPTGVELLDRTWTRILAFPVANCQTLQDIDELVGSDIPAVGLDEDEMEEEWEEIVVDIGRWILDSLVDEWFGDCGRPDPRPQNLTRSICLTWSHEISRDSLLLVGSHVSSDGVDTSMKIGEGSPQPVKRSFASWLGQSSA